MRFARRTLNPWFLLIALLAVPSAVVATHSLQRPLSRGQPLVKGDGLHYFAYLPSLVFDHDLDFRNDYAALGLTKREYLLRPGPTGHVPNPFPIGAAVLWLPFYLAGHVLALVLRACGAEVLADGRGPCYQLAVLVGTQVYVMLGLLILFRLLVRRFDRAVAGLAVVGIYAASFLVYYTTLDGSFAHGPSFFAAALLLAACEPGKPGVWRSVLVGASFGLLVLVRPDAAVLAPFPALALLFGGEAPRRNRDAIAVAASRADALAGQRVAARPSIEYLEANGGPNSVRVATTGPGEPRASETPGDADAARLEGPSTDAARLEGPSTDAAEDGALRGPRIQGPGDAAETRGRNVLRTAVLAAPALVAFTALITPQLLAWKVLYGGLLDARLAGGWFHPSSVPLVSVLFSSRNGLFSWSPVLLFATLGLVALLRRDVRFALAALASVAAAVYVYSTAADWWGGWAFGARRFSPCLPVFAFGLAAALDELVRRPRLAVGILLLPLVVHNLLNVELVRRGSIGKADTLSFARLGTERDDLFHQFFGSLETFPANLIFALRYGVPASRFDQIWGNHLDWDFHRRLDFDLIHSCRYLGRGWSDPDRTPDGRSVCWIVGPEATVLVDLRPVEGPRFVPSLLRLTLSPFPSLCGPGDDSTLLELHVAVNGHELEPVALVNRYGFVPVPLVVARPQPWTDGMNEIRLAVEGGCWQPPREAVRALRMRPVAAQRMGLSALDLDHLESLDRADELFRAAVDRMEFE